MPYALYSITEETGRTGGYFFEKLDLKCPMDTEQDDSCLI